MSAADLIIAGGCVLVLVAVSIAFFRPDPQREDRRIARRHRW